ncbi:MAG: putative glycoside hydrolase [Firmicutes bacterium]|nr:putative glycoside hydrolase [Bacillota bacterium]
MHRKTSIFVAIILVCQLCLLVWSGGGAREAGGTGLRPVRRGASADPQAGLGSKEEIFQTPPSPAPPPVPEPAPPPPPAPIRGIYATAYSAGSAERFARILEFIRRTEVNALVVDVKDDTGTISYESAVPLARAIGAGRRKFRPEEILAALAAENIYPIARIVVFKDPYLAERRPDLAVKSRSTGGLWRDRKGLAWVDPHNREVWRYVVDIAKEAAAKGFREIQFDYVRFTSDGNLADCVYPHADGRKRYEVIRDFLLFARAELKPLGVVVSADVFGLTCSAQDDLGIGQVIEEIAKAVDIISPMVYPSHYYPGTYGLPDPDAAPYETVVRSLRDALARLGGTEVRLRPWLQDFSLRHRYGRAELMAQIKAVYDAGLDEWLFWNPSNVYDAGKYNRE